VHNIGMPEARIILAQVTAYLASVPKSNAAYLAIDEALAEVQKNRNLNIPLHLRNAPTKLMKEIGYGEDYKYPHSFPGHFVGQQYLPDELQGRKFYNPTDIGRESKLKTYLDQIWKNKESK
jgi:putative ATPase